MIRIIACGKIKEKWLKEGIEEYTKRIRPYDKIEIIEVADSPSKESDSLAMREKVKEEEGERLLKQIKEDEFVILLDLAGKEKDSEALADFIQSLYNQSQNKIVFVVGGSLGVSPAVIKRANFRWKLSPNTFPHQLCRLILVEQISRAFKILHHEPYHK